MNDDDEMPFGKHQGKPMCDVPASYLLWLWNENYGQETNTKTKPVIDYIKENIDALMEEDEDTIVKGFDE